MKVGLLQMIQADKHPAPTGHPENPVRVQAAVDYVRGSDISHELINIFPSRREDNVLHSIHDRAYLDGAEQISRSGGGYLDGDTYMTAHSYEAAIETVFSVMGAIETIMSGEYKRIFAAVRPPGHHAERDRGMGFCIINNVAAAAELLVKNYGLRKIIIIDWDIHHGNGTQNIFYDRADIFYISLHQYPFYPGSGATSERGRGDGLGYTLNLPIPAGSGDDLYSSTFGEKIVPEMEKYQPQFIIISAGFDAHKDDPLGGMALSQDAFGKMTSHLVKVADKYAEGRILSVSEGGYNPSANSLSLYNHLKELQKE